jgi:hypothetical protein
LLIATALWYCSWETSANAIVESCLLVVGNMVKENGLAITAPSLSDGLALASTTAEQEAIRGVPRTEAVLALAADFAHASTHASHLIFQGAASQ